MQLNKNIKAMGNKLLKCAVIYFALIPSIVLAGAHQDCIDAAQTVLDDALAASTTTYNTTEQAAKDAQVAADAASDTTYANAQRDNQIVRDAAVASANSACDNTIATIDANLQTLELAIYAAGIAAALLCLLLPPCLAAILAGEIASIATAEANAAGNRNTARTVRDNAITAANNTQAAQNEIARLHMLDEKAAHADTYNAAVNAACTTKANADAAAQTVYDDTVANCPADSAWIKNNDLEFGMAA